MWKKILDFIFPIYSLEGSEGVWVTDEERIRLIQTPLVVEKPQLERIGLRCIDRVVAAALYPRTPLLTRMIRAFKYAGVRAFREELGRVILEGSFRLVPSGPLMLSGGVRGSPVLCAVPLHWMRLFHRGYNQAELLAQTVAKGRGWPLIPLLRRTRPTGHQAWRKQGERTQAVRNAFEYCPEGSSFFVLRFSLRASERRTKNEQQKTNSVPRYVILIDDISTTGATLEDCARALKEAGVERVDALVVAHG